MLQGVLSEKDLVDYCDGEAEQEPERHKKILSVLSNSAESRRHLAEIREKLYFVDTKVPAYRNNDDFSAEVSRLTIQWYEIQQRRLLMQKAHVERPLWRSYAFIVSLLFLLVIAIGVLPYVFT